MQVCRQLSSMTTCGRAWKLSSNLHEIYQCRMYSAKNPDDGQRNCPKHVEFLHKNKFGKLVRVLVLLTRNSKWTGRKYKSSCVSYLLTNTTVEKSYKELIISSENNVVSLGEYCLNFSKDYSASIFRVKQSMNSGLPDPEEESTMILRNVSKWVTAQKTWIFSSTDVRTCFFNSHISKKKSLQLITFQGAGWRSG